MNLKSIGISNFKAFGSEVQSIPIRPITLVFGPNSAGKSSLLHSLLWLNHVFQTGDCNVIAPQASSGHVNLGGFRQIQHRHQPEGVTYSLRFSSDSEPNQTEKSVEPIATSVVLDLTYGLLSKPNAEPAYGLTGSRILLDGKTFLKASSDTITELDLAHPCFFESAGKFSENSKEDVEKIQRFLADELSTGVSDLRIINGFPASWDCWWIEVFMPMNKLRASFKRGVLRFLKEVVSLKTNQVLKLLQDATKKSICELTYLPPVRELPPRGFDPSKRCEAAWREIARNPELVKQLNKWLSDDKMLGTGYRLENRAFLPIESIGKVSPELIRRELWDLLTNTNFACGAAGLIEDAVDEWLTLDKPSYVTAHPDLYNSLIDNELDDGKNGDYWEPPYASLTPEERIKEATSRADDCIHDDVYDKQIWDYFMAHNQPLTEFFEEKWSSSTITEWSGDWAARRLAWGIENECEDRKYELSLVQSGSETRLALQDVGYGISQFLPVLIHSFASKNQLIAIEQPEIHIHPRLQAELGDVFIESALGGNNNKFLLETHSEHLILRILRRIRETTAGEMADWPEALRKACPNGIRPEDVAVLYVEPGEDGAKVVELPVTSDGDFARPWPDGFFDERFNEYD
ncbi:MAG: DUF3696 domain-containing protein [Verrucomicrobia bacterium]|nr:DUF3696 domain-containing protein [Verrucomicrobiota bacterium]